LSIIVTTMSHACTPAEFATDTVINLALIGDPSYRESVLHFLPPNILATILEATAKLDTEAVDSRDAVLLGAAMVLGVQAATATIVDLELVFSKENHSTLEQG